MSALTIRNLDDEVKERLRVRAARNGRSMEAEARAILADAVAPQQINLAAALREAFVTFGGVELDIPERSQEGDRSPVTFDR